MSVSPDEMKETMRLWASGVTVVTTANDKTRAGVTASSFTSVSLEPPLILVCLYHEVGALEQIEQNGYFGVSLLGADHAAVSTQMAGFGDVPDGEDRFYGLDWMTVETGSPILTNALGYVDCKLHAIHEAGTHRIVLGEVVATGRKPEDETAPLVYYDRGYRQITDA